MPISRGRGDASPRRTLQIALLDEKRLDHVFYRVAFLADGGRQVVDTDGTAAEFLDHGLEQFAIHDVETGRIDIEHCERGIGNLARNEPARFHLRVIANAPQQPVRNAWRASRATGDLLRSGTVHLHLQQARRALHDTRKLITRVELETCDDAEAVAQRVREHAGSRRSADQRERLQLELHGTRRRTFADHDVDLEVFERRIEYLLDHRREPMDLVDEKNITLVEIAQDGGKVAGALQHGAGGMAQVHTHLARNDMSERGLAETRRTE